MYRSRSFGAKRRLGAAQLASLLPYLVIGPVFGFLFAGALLHFRGDRPVLGGLHALALVLWVGFLLFVEIRLI